MNPELGKPTSRAEHPIEASDVPFDNPAERKAAERRLAYLASFPEHNPNPIVEADAEGQVRYANPTAKRLFPDLAASGSAHPWLANWQEATREQVKSRTVVVGDRVYHQALHFVAEAGVVRSYGLDITERVRAEAAQQQLLEAVQAEKDRLAALVNSIQDEVWFADTQQHFTLANPAALRAFRLGADDAVDVERLAASLEVFRLDGSPRPVDQAPPLRALKGEPVVNEDEVVRIPATGELRYRQVTACPVKDAEGNIIGSVSVVRDVTERHHFETEREALLQQLTREKERVERMLDGMRDAFFTLDREWRITSVNQQQERVSQKKREQTLGRVFWEVWPETAEPDSKYWIEYHRVAETKIPSSFLAYFAPLDLWTDVDVYPNPDGGIAVFFRDVSDRVREQRALRRSEERFRTLADNAEDVITRFDRDGRYQYANPVVCKVVGLAAEAILGKTPEELGRNARADDMEHLVRQVFESGKSLRVDRKTVEGRWYDAQLIPEYRDDVVETVLTIARDVTERRKAEEALRESEATLRGILNAANESIWLFSADGVALMGNKTAIGRLGKPPEAVIGKAMRELVSEELARSRLECLKEVVRSQNPVEVEDIRDGIRFNHTYYPVFTDDGRVDRVAVFSRDVTERRRAAETLRRYELLANYGRDIVLFVRREDGRILDANAAATRVYGHSREEILSLTIGDLRHPSTMAMTAQQLAEADAHGVLFESVHRRKDGSPFAVEVSVRGAIVDGTHTRMSLIRDITDRKRADTALREAKQRLESLLENSPLAVVEWSCPDYRIVRWSPEAESVFGWTATEVVGKQIGELRMVYEEDAHLVEGVMADMLSGARPRNVNKNRNRRKDGSVIHCEWYNSTVMDSDGNVAAVLSLVLDVTELRQAEEARNETEQRLLMAQDAANAGTWEWDLQTGANYWSEPLWKIYGLDPGTTTPSYEAWRTTIHPDDVADAERAVQQAAGEGSIINAEWRVLDRDGTERWLMSRGQPVRDSGGAVVSYIGIVIDITARKRAEQALRESDRRKNEFLALLSHELRNPLAPICNSLYVLERANPGSDQARRAEAIIRRQTAQLTRLIDDLLDITRVSRDKVQLRCCSIDLNAVVGHAVEDHRSLFEDKGITLETTLAAEPLSIDGDEVRLAQVVGNLLFNAVKFTPKGGRIFVTTSKVGDLARLRVVDNGVGIEPAMLGQLFQPFMQADTTLDRNTGGLGLGLALVKGLVELHGGRVEVRSDGPQKGAEFLVDLPLGASANARASNASTAVASASRRVLVIEDNVDAAESLREALEFGEHVVEVAYSGPEGLRKARDFEPEVVLCDIGLPSMNGFEVARAFRADERFARVFLVALSGYALPDDLRRAAEAGFQQHLAKPPSLEQLERLLSAIPDAGDEDCRRMGPVRTSAT
jgi:PAS domain S-box-containing protein